jgi:hypothetical protein
MTRRGSFAATKWSQLDPYRLVFSDIAICPVHRHRAVDDRGQPRRKDMVQPGAGGVSGLECGRAEVRRRYQGLARADPTRH